MNEHLDPEGLHFSKEENDIDRALRPLSFDDFAGQDALLENLKFLLPRPISAKRRLTTPCFMGLLDWAKPHLRIFWRMNSE